MSKALLAFNGATLLGCAIFVSTAVSFGIAGSTVIIALLFFLPLIDTNFRINYFTKNSLRSYRVNMSCFKSRAFGQGYTQWLLVLVVCIYLLIFICELDHVLTAIGMLLLVALPEEWFFRVYFLTECKRQIDSQWWSNIITSILFTLLHMPTQGFAALLVFVPSLLLGYNYMKTNNILLTVCLHGLANTIYMLYIGKHL